TRFGLERGDIARLADNIELGLLRGQRPNPGLAGLRLLLAANLDRSTKHAARKLKPDDGPAIEALFTRIETALVPLRNLLAMPAISASEFAAALHAAFRAVADGAELPGRRELDAWAGQLAAQAGEGHRFAPRQLDGVLSALM